LSGQVVLITGGGGGVGRFLALNFARLNSKIVIWDVNRDGEQMFAVKLAVYIVTNKLETYANAHRLLPYNFNS
jgi:NAD(P)-dependent dehydrogenase (short-subunit alcohol dehydrogenase family)